ncbi:MAG: hypothetical protein B7X86_14450 [Sphingobacteriales bacterium 17-39-43]|uniref:hypothetical protein n=1 Tax=Daejeonella sp. TaxID=2805397 RepID=UPI000BC403C4|nr:hypothetical protein [Daejeonella sp.]OYZ30148.1 MAG: hypothetical protein B7Y24_14215 [Sphingobacteriales bacterium 16-39-50]OZA22866.1 MAG: hypothetical protein B7X86_14450 [Sphingobacteriales bacterium 17-39-43]HQT23983.1 hypothetical protein [Daejeonella sp.]HQT58647.1 hypothetical protein [Daejeonella sp.]
MNRIIVILQIFSILIISCNNKSIEFEGEDSVAVLDNDTSTIVPIAPNEVDTLLGSINSQPTLILENQYEYLLNHLNNDLQKNPMKNLESEGVVFLEWKQFSGDNIPFICYVSKNIKSFYLDGKKVPFTPDKEYFFRQNVNLYIGYNRIPVKLINKSGKVLDTYIEINMERTSK